jgi:hypothetical protein
MDFRESFLGPKKPKTAQEQIAQEVGSYVSIDLLLLGLCCLSSPPTSLSCLASSNLLPSQLTGCCPKLTYTQRAYGFGICMGIGMFMNVVGWLLMFQKNYVGFAVLYTFGNVVALCATGFFTGPKKQCKVGLLAPKLNNLSFVVYPPTFSFQLMMKKGRYIGVMVYFFAMVMTLFFAFFKKIPDDPPTARLVLVLMSVTVQLLALFWYSMSYVPFGHTM